MKFGEGEIEAGSYALGLTTGEVFEFQAATFQGEWSRLHGFGRGSCNLGERKGEIGIPYSPANSYCRSGDAPHPTLLPEFVDIRVANVVWFTKFGASETG